MVLVHGGNTATRVTAPVTAAMAGSGLGFVGVDELDVIGVKPPAARGATAIPACGRPRRRRVSSLLLRCQST